MCFLTSSGFEDRAKETLQQSTASSGELAGSGMPRGCKSAKGPKSQFTRASLKKPCLHAALSGLMMPNIC